MFLIRRDEVGDVVGYLSVVWIFVVVVGYLLLRKNEIQPVRPTPALQWTKIGSEEKNCFKYFFNF